MGHNVTPHEPCPICGKPDWCKWVDGNNGPLICCHRSETQSNLLGMDGRNYLFIHLSKGGSCVYGEQEQEEAGKRRWIEEQMRINPNFKYRGKNNMRSVSATAVTKVKSRAGYKHAYYVADDEHPEHLDAVYRALLKRLALDNDDKKYLLSEKWEEKMFTLYNVKSLPMVDRRRYELGIKSYLPWRKAVCRSIEEELGADCFIGVPGFFKDKNGNWTIHGAAGGAIIFPLFDLDGRIIRLRLRPKYGDEDKERASEKGIKLPKYISMTSYKEVIDDENEIISNALDCGCQATSRVGFYLYDTEGNWQKDFSLLFTTEGEKKSMVYNYYRGIAVACLPGVGTWSNLTDDKITESLKAKGTEYIVVGFDADKETNANVLRSERNAVDALKELGFQLAVANWNQKIAKGIDDLTVLGLEPELFLC